VTAPPPISVLLPVRDGAATLEDAIASVEAQTDPDFEVLAVDDGSTDATPDILEAWARRDARVRVLRQPAGGIVVALERSRSEARGRYLARMDADDVCEPERMARQRELLEAEKMLVGCGCFVRYFPREAVRAGARRYERWMNGSSSAEDVERELFVECPLAHPTFFLRADSVQAVGGYRDPGWAEDHDLVLRLWEAGGRLAKVPEILFRWREGDGRLSRVGATYAQEAFVRCKVHFLRRTLLRHREGAIIWGAGPVGKAFARELIRGGVPLRAFVEVDPRKIGQEIHGAPVLDTDAGLKHRTGLHLAAVGQPGARSTLRGILSEAGLREMRDFVAVA
jgi:glycosyltransferase involved in cell wall biosynthesis